MFFIGTNENYEGRITAIGEFVKVDGDFVVLKIGKSMLKVKHNGLENYKTKFIMVSGNYENGILNEEKIQKINEDFDYATFLRLAKASNNYSEIF
jgi:hypothetical protein